jgi:homocysteine S-methyltransferase
MPNAGMPREVGGRRMYMASAEYFATYARHLVQGGAKVVGGAAAPRRARAGMRRRCAWSARWAVEAGAARRRTARVGGRHRAPRAAVERCRRGSRLAQARRGTFVTRSRSSPPRGIDDGQLVADAGTLHRAGGWTPSTSPTGRARRAAWAPSPRRCSSSSGCGIEAVTHYACRDRNLLGMLSDLLGARRSGCTTCC